ncbi:RadC family protein [Dyadobacter arcticus]|uniref:DNA repair protein RadC n=1 Tax=Dyadobacter arcticus TaxID=1078754 RepID=A0ABX0UGK1_9BACT|nr:DNA repair protein RadC [Dyadobacter arcticus]NIJ52106.1 DNA repair protein RadC [Dyadobacter arcticus]
MSKPKSENARNILNWAEDDRPREKLELKGKSALSDAELIALLIGSGTFDMSAVDVGKVIMGLGYNNINELAKLDVKDLTKIKGIGVAKATTIVAALELGRRRSDTIPDQKRKITSSEAVYREMKQYLLDKPNEEFWILLLNRANFVIRALQVSVGGIAGTAVDIKLIFKLAIDHLASSLILVHNHPSGQLEPSHADVLLTTQIKQAGHLLDMPVLDHMIFTDEGFYSFTDSGEM